MQKITADYHKINLHQERCIYCAGCVGVCPVDALVLRGETLTIDNNPCINCGLCIQFCPVGALEEGSDYGKKAIPQPKPIFLVE